MEEKYLCPTCKKKLNIGEDIVLVGEKDKFNIGLLFLHTDLGNYSLKKTDDIRLEKGDIVEITCPICSADLTYKFKLSYASLIKVEGGEEVVIVFF